MSQKVYHTFDNVTNLIRANSQVPKLNNLFKFNITRIKEGNSYKTLEVSFLFKVLQKKMQKLSSFLRAPLGADYRCKS